MDVHALNTHNFRWSLIPMNRNQDKVPYKYPEVPFQRYGHTAVAHGNNVYIWGGRNDEMVLELYHYLY